MLIRVVFNKLGSGGANSWASTTSVNNVWRKGFQNLLACKVWVFVGSHNALLWRGKKRTKKTKQERRRKRKKKPKTVGKREQGLGRFCGKLWKEGWNWPLQQKRENTLQILTIYLGCYLTRTVSPVGLSQIYMHTKDKHTH